MTPTRKPVIVFLTASWTNIDDRIRQGDKPGGVPSVYRIWERCLRRGWDVHVFVSADLEEGFPRQTEALGGVKFHWVPRVAPRWTRWLQKRGFMGIFTPQWPLNQFRMAWRFFRSGVRPDVVYAMRQTYSLLGWLICRLMGAKMVQRTYGTWLYHVWFEQSRWWPRIREVGAWIGLRVPVDLSIMENDGTRGDRAACWAGVDMRKFRFWINGVDKSMKIPGFDRTAFKRKLGLSPDAPMLLVLGRLDSWKRVDRSLDAMPAILKEFPQARMFIVGTGPLRAALEDRAHRLGIWEAVTFVGAVGHDKIQGYLNATDLYLQGHDLSNLSNTFIEALTTGCCVITRDVGTTYELITDGQNGTLLSPGEADQYAAAAVGLLKNPAERRRLADAAYQHAMKKFQTWDERMDMEVDELQALLADRLAPSRTPGRPGARTRELVREESGRDVSGERQRAPVRVCHVSTAHPALDARIFYREALTLRDLGYAVTVVGVHPRDECVEGVRIHGLAKLGRLRRLATAWWRGLAIVSRCPADLYQFHDPELLPTAVLAKTFLGKKVVFDAHESVALILLKDWLPKWLRRPIKAAVESVDRSCGSRVDAVITSSRLLTDRYRRFARRSESYHNFPAPEFLHARDSLWQPATARKREVVHVGTLSAYRIEFLVQVARQFLSSHADWRWTFIGMRPDQRVWLERNRPEELQDRLVGLESVPHLEVARRCCQARIGVNYQHVGSEHLRLVIPLKVFEYLACGLVAVSTRAPLLVELVEDCPAVRFCDESAEGVLAQLAAAAGAADWKASSDVARRFADERFNCQAEALRLAAVYEDILNSGGPGDPKTDR